MSHERRIMMLDGLAAAIGIDIGARLRTAPDARVHGGSINECFRWESDSGSVFVKVARAGSRSMLEAEAAGLQELRRANAVRVPQVLSLGANEVTAWLALEWIQPGGRSRETDRMLGEQLAQQHRFTGRSFGWFRDNTLGSTPQLNGWLDDWVIFFRDRRLRFQLELAARTGLDSRLQRRGELLLERLPEFFLAYRPVPSLLHGDLWGGNRTADERGSPVIFDPAVYYGDREADVAMTRLFGGFGADFHSAYASAWAPDAGAQVRAVLYNLYHVLNHLNLFGGGYRAQALAMLDELLAELGH